MNRRGFTFTEILFAVLLLGVGIIMMAALFPVSARQIQNSATDAVTSSVGPAALRQIQWAVGPGGAVNLPATGSAGKPGAVMAFADASPTIWNQLRANQILAADPRFGWTALYRRNAGDDFAQIWVIAAQSSITPAYSYSSQLQPLAVTVTLTFGPPGTAAFSAFGATDNTSALATGCYVIIADDHASGAANGRIYQLAANAGSANTWNLDPGYDLQSASENLVNAKAYILGRAWTGNEYDGVAQDVAIYCGCVSLY